MPPAPARPVMATRDLSSPAEASAFARTRSRGAGHLPPPHRAPKPTRAALYRAATPARRLGQKCARATRREPRAPAAARARAGPIETRSSTPGTRWRRKTSRAGTAGGQNPARETIAHRHDGALARPPKTTRLPAGAEQRDPSNS